MVNTCIITGFGINADNELAEAFRLSGSSVLKIHIKDLIREPELLKKFDILGFPGGFSFGDHLGSGLVFARIFKKHLKSHLNTFIASGSLIIGICNGFQVLVKMGVLPNVAGDWIPEVSLIHNDSGVFENSWVNVTFNKKCKCIWTQGLNNMDLPIRHGEGQFVTISQEILDTLCKKELIALKYSERNPNGSQQNIAGITDQTGNILGLMPHPEAFIYQENHPEWTRKTITEGYGLKIFQNGVDYIKAKRQKNAENREL